MTKSPLKIQRGTDKDAPESAPKSNLGRHDKMGRELPDARPMEPPAGYVPSPSIAEMIQQMVTSSLIKQQLAQQGDETFEEANNFDIPDDPVDPSSPYEQHYFEEAPLEVLAAREKAGQPLHDVQPAASPPEPSGGAGGPLPPSASPTNVGAGVPGAPKAR